MAGGVGGAGSSGSSNSHSSHAASSGSTAGSTHGGHGPGSPGTGAKATSHAQSTAHAQTHTLAQSSTKAQSMATAQTPASALANAATPASALTGSPTSWPSMAQAKPAPSAPHALGQWQTAAIGASKSVFHDGSVKEVSFPKLDRGKLAHNDVHAVVLHRTDSSTAKSTLNHYADPKTQFAAHYLIDKDGTIFQTMPADRKVNHVGPIKSRAQEENTLTAQERKLVKGLTNGALSQYENTKAYPDRYPTSRDSIGIEVVGKSDAKTQQYGPATPAQLKSLDRLVDGLQTRFGLADDDVYAHANIAYKQPTEGTNLGYPDP